MTEIEEQRSTVRRLRQRASDLDAAQGLAGLGMFGGVGWLVSIYVGKPGDDLRRAANALEASIQSPPTPSEEPNG